MNLEKLKQLMLDDPSIPDIETAKRIIGAQMRCNQNRAEETKPISPISGVVKSVVKTISKKQGNQNL